MMFRLMLLIGVITLCLGCDDSRPSVVAASTNAPAQPLASAKAATEPVFVASGPLIVENQVDVDAQKEGTIASIAADTGTRVQTGEILAQLDDRQARANLEAAAARTRSTEADLHNWEAEAKVLDADLRRAEKLWEAGVIPQEQMEHVRYKAESDHWDVERVQQLLVDAQATEHSLQLELEKTKVVAPFDGIVARRYARVGQKIAVGDRLFWVTAESPLRVRFTLPETFMGRISKGQHFALTSPDIQSQQWNTAVVQISPVVDPSSGTIEVLCEVLGPPAGLRPGMTANVRVPTNESH
ncbi:MAG: efflux RND transporter periplasmic adaptor subunit [Acidobacteriaceae bacterium]|nr:efflux RND transporter periplasmic adaptor subunit [Acidobacteriaceae bacterium]